MTYYETKKKSLDKCIYNLDEAIESIIDLDDSDIPVSEYGEKIAYILAEIQLERDDMTDQAPCLPARRAFAAEIQLERDDMTDTETQIPNSITEPLGAGITP